MGFIFLNSEHVYVKGEVETNSPYPNPSFSLEYGDRYRNSKDGNLKLEIHADDGFLIESVLIEFVDPSPEPTPSPKRFDFNNEKLVTVNVYINSTVDVHITVDLVSEDGSTPTVTGTFNNLYVVTNKDLRKMSTYYRIDPEQTHDITPYVLNILRLPFPLPDNLKGDAIDTIRLGEYAVSDVEAVEVKTDLAIIDIGKIEIPSKYGNSYDYNDTQIFLHLPYCNTIELDINYCIGETIRIEYVIDLYSGDSTVNVYSSKIDDVFHSEQFGVGTTVPFIHTQSKNTTSEPNNVLRTFNNLSKAYIEVSRNKPYNESSMFNEYVSVDGVLSEHSGYVVVENIDLKTNATLDEQNTIKNILSRGVYIK